MGENSRPRANSGLATKSQRVAGHNSSQLRLVHENVFDLVHSVVAALGGPKEIGPKLFPAKTPDSAARYLADCLNPNRDHDIGIETFLTLMRWARESGVHFGMEWIADEVGYTRPSPIEPEDQRADLQRQFLAGVAELEQLARKLQR